MNFERLRNAHEAELREAGIIPGVLIQQDKLVAAFAQYLALKDSKAFYSGISELLKDGGAERKAQEVIAERKNSRREDGKRPTAGRLRFMQRQKNHLTAPNGQTRKRGLRRTRR